MLLLEVIFYGIHFYAFYGIIIWGHSQKLLQYCNGYWACHRHLNFQWFGWEVDLADSQWKSFHNNLVLLSSVAIGLTIVNVVIRFVAPNYPLHHIRLLSGLIILFVQHSFHSIIVLTLALGAYLVSHVFCGTVLGPYAVWGYAFFILAFKESYRLLSNPQYNFLSIFFNQRYGGMHGWQFAANFLILRVISFGIDLHNVRLAERKVREQKKSDSTEAEINDSGVVSAPLNSQLEAYNMVNFFSYVVYAPLYVAGPIISFQDYIKFDNKSQKEEFTTKYAIRFIVLLLLMEWSSSRFPVFALMQSGIIPHMPVADIAITFFIILKLMWLKFTTLWRFFRLWALADGVFVEENMLRCMSNNYSLEQFWRGWHASFNKWIVRYIYVPWGGRSYRWVSVWFIFLFVALWHDVEWKLIAWGLMNGVFYVAELGMKSLWKSATIDRETGKLRIPTIVDNFISSLAGALYIMILMVINLVGYALGTGMLSMLKQKILTWDGLTTFLVSVYFLSIGVSLMLTLRHYKLCSA
jgi:D-alanyl-lipoteichoic acid acyltransferase DltB (MBOAT superfamily)